MATMDIFEGDAFTIVELTRALENIPFKPALLSGSNLFSPRGVRSRTVVIESRDGTLSLIPFSERGSAYEQQVPDRREMRAFVCRQFKKQDVIWASEVQSVRDFGSESATQQVQTEVAYRLRKLRQDAETTFEYHLLNGIQGIVKDPKDNATVVNYFTEFGISPAAEIDFDLDNASPASGALRKRCQALIEDVEASMGGLSAGAVQVRAECGSAFFADLVAHKEVRETYLNTAAAADLRGRVADEVSFGGITFRRYRGGVGFGVPTDKAFFFPEGIEGLFEIYYAPADTFETVNTLGQQLYARTIPDRDRDEWVRLEIESNPLPICTRPQVLRSGAADLMTAFAAALDALFADGNIARDAVHIADGGVQVLVRVVTRRADEVTGFGEARLWSETTRLDLRVAEVPNPRPGDRIEIDGEAFLIQGEPVRDRERLVWTVDLRPA